MKRSAVVAGVCAWVFVLIVMLLGYVQPGYNHWTDTTSQLVFGQFGLIQQLNFVVLAISLLAIGYSLGRYFYGLRANPIFYFFVVTAALVLSLVFFPSDPDMIGQWSRFAQSTVSGKIHFMVTFAGYLLAPIPIFLILNTMKKRSGWQRIFWYTIFVLVSNAVVGGLWFVLVGLGYLDGIRGAVQKFLMFNALIWISVVAAKIVVSDNASDYSDERR